MSVEVGKKIDHGSYSVLAKEDVACQHMIELRGALLERIRYKKERV